MKQKIPRGPMPPQIKISDKQDTILQQIIRRATSPQNLVLRAKIVRAGTEYGRRNTQISQDLQCSSQTVHKWRHRWIDGWEQLVAIEANGDDRELEAGIITVLADLP